MSHPGTPRPDRLLTDCPCCICDVRRLLWKRAHKRRRRKVADILSFEELHATGVFPQRTARALLKIHSLYKTGKLTENNTSVRICRAMLEKTKRRKK